MVSGVKVSNRQTKSTIKYRSRKHIEDGNSTDKYC